MLWQFVAILCGGGLVGVALWLASKNGSKSAQLAALKAEIKKQAEEQARARKISDSVAVMDEHTVRQRLHQVANEQRRRM